MAEQAQSGTLYQSGNPYLTAKAVKCFESVSVYLNTFFWHKQSWSSTSESSSWAAVLLSMLKLSKLGCTALKRNHSPCTGTSRIDLFSLLKKILFIYDYTMQTASVMASEKLLGRGLGAVLWQVGRGCC